MRPSQDKIKEVFEANLKLKEYGLVKFTWGNVSALDRETGLVLIKPSGVPYETMTADDIVCVTPDGERVYGKLRPSSDPRSRSPRRPRRSPASRRSHSANR